MKNESETLGLLEKSLEGQKYDEDLPVLNMLAEASVKRDRKYMGMTWGEMHEALQSNPAIQKIEVIQGATHYIHSTHAAEMARLAEEFINTLDRDAQDQAPARP